MNDTFRRVAAFCGLRLSYYSTAALLAVIFFILALTDYRTASPLYILLTLAVMPTILKSMFFSATESQKRENDMAFPLFCQKYKYDIAMYNSLQLAHILLFVLFAAWHISYSLSDGTPAIVTAIPSLIAAICLLIRIFGTIGYRLYFRFFPLKAMR